MQVTKVHACGNDFVVLADLDGTVTLDAATVRALCDRHRGVGGDGVIRIAPSSDAHADVFMDYRNADGSVAQMCGNGIRVFAAYLEHSGLRRLADGERLDVATRAGVKTVRRVGTPQDPDGCAVHYAADLGPWRLVGGDQAAAAGGDVHVHLAGSDVAMAGLSIDVGNPHVVVAVPSVEALAGVDLSVPPRVDPTPPQGCNVEVVVPDPATTARLGRLTMRVRERGVGETRSCGTGAVAAALAVRVWGGHGAPDEWVVHVPGGRLGVRAAPAERVAGQWVELSGPAVVVADGVLV